MIDKVVLYEIDLDRRLGHQNLHRRLAERRPTKRKPGIVALDRELSRWDANESLEVPAEVTLIKKANLNSNESGWHSRGEQPFGLFDSNLQEQLVGRRPKLFSKYADQI